MSETEWVVAKGWGGFECLPVSKRSEKLIEAAEAGRKRRFLAGDVLAVLPESHAKALTERLKSSANLAREERSAADYRHRLRIAELVKKYQPKTESN